MLLTKREKTHQSTSSVPKIKPFVAEGKTIRIWVRVDLDPEDLEEIMPYVKKSYERVLTSGN